MKNSTLLFTFLALLISAQVSFGQRNCNTMEHLEMIQSQHPEVKDNMKSIEQFTQKYLSNPTAKIRAGELLTIPVVFHVIYANNAENLSDAQLISQLDVLNEDFRRLNGDADNVWNQAADTEIEFCLATTGPDGNPTTGIQRRSNNKRSWRTNDDMKRSNKGGIDAWDASRYLNIWVCDISGGILGYAQFPGGPAATDGVVLDYAYTGRGGSAVAPFDLGRTGTHEVGHWLNLRHIWGDGPCGADDFVGDTPASDAPNYGCALGHVSCSSTDMVQNYMDYSDDACMNLYTAGQRDRMQALFANGGARASLLSSDGCGNPPTATCSDGIQNGNETGIDCGGSCPPCNPVATCDDGIQNGNETGIDCGGDCTPCATGSCDTPANPFASNIKRNRANLNWSAVSGAVSYDVQIRSQGSSSWQTFNASGTSLQISGLSNNTTYEWGVSANCGGNGSSSYTNCTFTAGDRGSGACGNNRLSNTYTELSVFPNPSSDFINITMNYSELETVNIKIVDIHGKILQTEVVAGAISNLQFDVSSYTNGIYFITTETDQGYHQTKRFIVSH